jgi:hypothetical protein
MTWMAAAGQLARPIMNYARIWNTIKLRSHNLAQILLQQALVQVVYFGLMLLIAIGLSQ